jgi:hypothetical protein
MSEGAGKSSDGRRPPLRARLHRYKLTSSELVLLQAMCEHCSSGETIWASTERLADYSKLSQRQVQRIIKGLLNRRILRELAPASRKKKRPATYAITEAALPEDSRVMRYLNRQKQYALPGVHLASVPGEPISDPNQATPCREVDDSLSRVRDTMSPNSEASNSKRLNGIQHGDAAMMLPPDGDSTLQSMPAWGVLKEQLRNQLSPTEWDLWVRPMFLLKATPVEPDGKHFLAALPRSSKIQAAALNRLELMRELLAPARIGLSLTPRPDEYEISEAQKRYGKDMAPKPWTRKGSA